MTRTATYLRRRITTITLHVTDRPRPVLHALASGLACLVFFGVLSCLMTWFA